MVDDDAEPACWACGRQLDPAEPRRLVEVPGTDAGGPRVREVVVCLGCFAGREWPRLRVRA
jgi:hypothetical protein